MKIILKALIFTGLIVLCTMSCQKSEFGPVIPTKVASVTNLKYTLLGNGDTVLLTWTLPAGNDSLSVTILNGSNTYQLPLNATSFKFGIITTNVAYSFTIKISDTKGNISLGNTIHVTRSGAYAVSGFTAQQTYQGVLFTWNRTDPSVNKIVIQLGTYETYDKVPSGASDTTLLVTNVPYGTYKISVLCYGTNSTLPSNTIYSSIKVGAIKIAFLGDFADSLTMLSQGDGEVTKSAAWLFSAYPNLARYVSFAMIKSGAINLSQYRVIWWNYDNYNSNVSIPADATDSSTLAALTNWYKNGGNFLFSNWAVQYYFNLGRISQKYIMPCLQLGTGSGGDDPNIWWVQTTIGANYNDTLHDESGHPIFQNITMTVSNNPVSGNPGVKNFPVIGNGWKHNHNAILNNLNTYYGNVPYSFESTYTGFNNDNNTVWLGQWGTDWNGYQMLGMLEFLPNATFQGHGLWFGIGGVEWDGDDDTGGNPYQATIKLLYGNAINYLRNQ